MIKAVEMQTPALEEMKNFYVNTLGLTLVQEQSTSFSVQVGVSSLTFKKSDPNGQPKYHFAFNIPENKIDEALRWITPKVQIILSQGHEIVHFESWNADSIYFYDPAGNIVELIARHNLDNSANEAFSPASLLCVSEIGLPVPDVEEALLKLSRVGIVPWQDSSSQFAAAGDECGLIIAVKQGRIWFMSDQEEAYPHPLTIKTDVCEITLDYTEGMQVKELR
ncbi:glyoxalase/bleomycin resistance/dioxygenase family protein [Paenibacillus tritici]|uniref:Glyoxalase/bleomycin resistance/dioxygenase family protein n=1 Tax=Paenibacillus tritici TaxID=1873425 RepID=A0ABX2DVJ5_9BACL|nr:VOC family protein [Paenibacillus tritici]NQX48592.1 glyoxalase/bleomycin resistance/dioxygenase family protein [Paenibacillus tritici]